MINYTRVVVLGSIYDRSRTAAPPTASIWGSVSVASEARVSCTAHIERDNARRIWNWFIRSQADARNPFDERSARGDGHPASRTGWTAIIPIVIKIDLIIWCKVLELRFDFTYSWTEDHRGAARRDIWHQQHSEDGADCHRRPERHQTERLHSRPRHHSWHRAALRVRGGGPPPSPAERLVACSPKFCVKQLCMNLSLSTALVAKLLEHRIIV